MRIYKKDWKEQQCVESVACNKCGKIFVIENDVIKEECVHMKHAFGFFSEKDGIKHSFDLCEACYDAIVKDFQIPVTEEEIVEFV